MDITLAVAGQQLEDPQTRLPLFLPTVSPSNSSPLFPPQLPSPSPEVFSVHSFFDLLQTQDVRRRTRSKTANESHFAGQAEGGHGTPQGSTVLSADAQALHAAAVWCNKTAGFEVVHGLLDRIMLMLEIPRIRSDDFKAETGYYIKERDDPTFFPGRAATIYYRLPKGSNGLTVLKRTLKAALNNPDDLEIGVLGILHPTVLEKFEISYPCSALEFTLEPFKKELQTVWT
ncbi:hypothetical protein NUW54_g3349 [Trametes sanguinea]|uniref:Uncharacterized protein n=1 Tax=Trametes sanguinea TaxID=158606 RepID=A0ACC1Q368_9APHY|nr:hypothetical protein NUW54_g3349 [Trametes sanguinea]